MSAFQEDLEQDPPPPRFLMAIFLIVGLAWIGFCFYWLGRLAWWALLWLSKL